MSKNETYTFFCLLFRSTSLMQLIALVYKDQHVHKLERLLNDWLETSLSESSEDNESNTSPQDQIGSCSSPALTSAEPTDDSSDGTGNGKHSSCELNILLNFFDFEHILILKLEQSIFSNMFSQDELKSWIEALFLLCWISFVFN